MKRPRRGSLQYWPRKRAKRIYPRESHYPDIKDAMPLGFAGWKAGMTHVQYVETDSHSPRYGKTTSKAVTILDAPSLLVCGIRYYKKEPALHVSGEKWTEKFPKDLDIKRKIAKTGSSKEQVNFDDVRLIVSTQPAKSGMRKKKPEVFELGIGGDAAAKKEYAEKMLGKEISAKDVFKSGEIIDVSAVTKGHGFTGPVKRYGIRIQGRKDKQMHRHVGAIGSTTPRHIDWRVPQAGQYGFFTRTEFSKRLIMIDDDGKKVIPKGGFLGYGNPQSFIMIEGSVPGPRKRLIRIRKTIRGAKFSPIEIKYISIDSKQGK
ncbi:MAG TPA: 50S ribosomal protein L3 [archaeon]|nr:50S ribosomal protein L3 [archaeon]